MVKGADYSMSVGKAIKELRREDDLSQLQLSFELNVSRESVSAYETERAKLPQDVSQKLMERFDDPFFAMEVANSYTGGGWVRKLDGEYVDLHRSSVKEKTMEEIDELTQALESFSFSTPPRLIKTRQRQDLENMTIEAVDVVYSVCHLLAVICKDYGFSWNEIWNRHAAKLIANGYVKKDNVGA